MGFHFKWPLTVAARLTILLCSLLCAQVVQSSVSQLHKMVECTTNSTGYDLIGYGCYCGLGDDGGAPVDGIDVCCKRHDHCYEGLTPEASCGTSHPYFISYLWRCVPGGGSTNTPTCPDWRAIIQEDEGGATPLCQAELCVCDRELAMCLRREGYGGPGGRLHKTCVESGEDGDGDSDGGILENLASFFDIGQDRDDRLQSAFKSSASQRAVEKVLNMLVD